MRRAAHVAFGRFAHLRFFRTLPIFFFLFFICIFPSLYPQRETFYSIARHTSLCFLPHPYIVYHSCQLQTCSCFCWSLRYPCEAYLGMPSRTHHVPVFRCLFPVVHWPHSRSCKPNKNKSWLQLVDSWPVGVIGLSIVVRTDVCTGSPLSMLTNISLHLSIQRRERNRAAS
jgi:hypothetical protein